MKVLFILDPLSVGGAQVHTADLAESLSSFDCRLLGIDGVRSAALGRKGEEAMILGLRALDPRTWPRLGAAIAAQKPDLVVSINQVATLATTAARLAGWFRSPHAVIFHSTSVTNAAGWLRTAPFIPAVWTTDGLAYVSRNQAAIWRARGLCARRTVTIRNGIRTDRYPAIDVQERRAAKARLGYAETDVVLGICAMLRYEKNHEQLIHALKRLRDAGHPAKALLVGDGPRRQTITDLAQSLGVSEHVNITGLQSDVRPFLAAMDVGVLCSNAIETLSLAALECLSSGLPMVMSDTGGASEIIQDGENGYLFPVNDTAALVDRLNRCMDVTRRAAMAANARRSVVENFDHKMMVAGYQDFFKSLVS